MTIKQQGGIFGRNPTFNDVEVEGNLTVGGSAISSVGTMASQDADNVNIDGGAIDGTTLGESTRSTGKFTTVNTSSYLTVESSGGSGLRMYGSSGTNQWDVYLNSTNLRFSDNTGGGVVQFDTNVNLNNSNLVIGTSGKGIDFSATSGTGTSELFDDYEEGSFTVTFSPQTSGSLPVNSSLDTLSYTKIGRLVHCVGAVRLGSPSSAVGAYFNVSGLPYSVGDLSEISERAGGSFVRAGASITNLPYILETTVFRVYVVCSTLALDDDIYFNFSYHTA